MEFIRRTVLEQKPSMEGFRVPYTVVPRSFIMCATRMVSATARRPLDHNLSPFTRPTTMS